MLVHEQRPVSEILQSVVYEPVGLIAAVLLLLRLLPAVLSAPPLTQEEADYPRPALLQRRAAGEGLAGAQPLRRVPDDPLKVVGSLTRIGAGGVPGGEQDLAREPLV